MYVCACKEERGALNQPTRRSKALKEPHDSWYYNNESIIIVVKKWYDMTSSAVSSKSNNNRTHAKLTVDIHVPSRESAPLSRYEVPIIYVYESYIMYVVRYLISWINISQIFMMTAVWPCWLEKLLDGSTERQLGPCSSVNANIRWLGRCGSAYKPLFYYWNAQYIYILLYKSYWLLYRLRLDSNSAQQQNISC